MSTHCPDDCSADEEALSLSDLPLDDSDAGDFPSQTQRSAPESAPEFFEFLSDDNASEMCAADDIFLCGKLVPFNDPSVSSTLESPLRKRSESLSGLPSRVKIRNNNSNNNNTLLRNSRSLDYRKLRRSYSSWACPDSGMERNPSVRSIESSELPSKKSTKRRWYVFVFGTVKFPPEMELKDIKSRQFRRNPSVMFPSNDASKSFPRERSSSGKCNSWSLLKALSCRDDATVAATAPLCVPEV